LIDLIVVGVGDHYSRILGPSIDKLQQQEFIRLVATVDVRPANPELHSLGAVHLIRNPDGPLSDLLRPFAKDDPLVYLAHAHTWHAKDAIDLTRAGFRVAIEKPYAVSLEEMHELESHMRASPHRFFLSEYYLVKSAPLLHAFQMVAGESFLVREAGFLRAGSKWPLNDLVLVNLIGRNPVLLSRYLGGRG
jgi:predicted dehydrogenase